ncbi:MAG: hypothetical protein A3G75_09780 [Verrucomicrobia bacterium RIFCSPLOWO2_12_FULL_64_8]|nr:MAG: hypothetical protein A3G75_09780 [Verrucomicrobia bacterium RIFCSPLOWO2_12_FULL_64_8]
MELVVRRIFAGKIRGERKSPRRGLGSEFADYRDYVQGDDPRFIDWNLWGRLDRFFVKLYHEEEDLHLSIFLDTSMSMKFGEPAKLRAAMQLAAGTAYVGLCNFDRVSIEANSADGRRIYGPARGKRNMRRLLDFFAELEPGGSTDLAPALKSFSLRNRSPGMKVVISDFLDRSGYEPALRWLLQGPGENVILHILSPQEVNPDLVGDLALIDGEDGGQTDVSITGGLIRRYKKNLANLCGGLQQFCRRRGMLYFFLQSTVPLEDVLLKAFRQARVFK